MATQPKPRPDVPARVDLIFRRVSGDLTARLARQFGLHRLQLAEDAVQEAMVAALRSWPTRGVPDKPVAWLYAVAKNRAIDTLRRQHREPITDGIEDHAVAEGDQSGAPPVDRLDLLMMLVSSNAPLGPLVALALKTVFGFSVREVSLLLGLRMKTVEVRLYRARVKLRAQYPGAAVSESAPATPDTAPVPDEARRDALLHILFLVFTEGFARPRSRSPIEVDLVAESISLLETLIARPGWNTPRTRALLAVFYLQGSRIDARELGFVPLTSQNRSLWRSDWIQEGLANFRRSMEGDAVNRYHIEAAIAASYATTIDGADPPWDQIVDLLGDLNDRYPSPVTAMRRAVVIGHRDGPDRGAAELELLSSNRILQRNLYFHCAVAHFRAAVGDSVGAVEALDRAKRLTRADSERLYIDERRGAILEGSSSLSRPTGPLPR